MAKLSIKYFKTKEKDGSETVLPKLEIIQALKAYKKQNPAKYALKKDSLFKRYGITKEAQEDVEQVIEDELDKELDEVEAIEVTGKGKKKK